MTRPNEREITYDEHLVEKGYEMWSLSDLTWPAPHPYEIMYYPDGWLDQLYAFHQGVRFYEDSDRREFKGLGKK